MNLTDKILDHEDLMRALHQIKNNKGKAGIDGMSVEELDLYFFGHEEEICAQIRERRYCPLPVKRVYIEKPNSNKKRPLGIPSVVDRVIQQAVAQQLSEIYEPLFSEHSHGFRPGRSCHTAVHEVLGYLNAGYEWVVDLDIEKFFDTVNQDKLISIIREKVNDRNILHLIRSFLKAGVMEDGIISPTPLGMPQGGPLSVICSNIYLDKLDKELEQRGLNFSRYADDTCVYVKSEKSANRVMKSISSWIERKLFLKVNATKTKVVRPNKSIFLGFTFLRSKGQWRCKPADDRKKRLYDKLKVVLLRKRAVACTLADTITKVNQILRGWINYFRIGMMKSFLIEFGMWLRHKIRVIILKMWKRPKTIFRHLTYLNKIMHCHFSFEDIFKVANSRLGWYRRATGNVVNFILSPKFLEKDKGDCPGLVNPLSYYLDKLCIM